MGELPQTPDVPPEGTELRTDSAQRSEQLAKTRIPWSRVTAQSPSEALQPDTPPPPPPVPPRRRRPTLSALSGFLSFLLVVAFVAIFGLVWNQQRLRAPGPLAASKVLYIAPGTEVPDIIDLLDREGVIDSPFLLNVELVLENNRSKVKAGEYLFKQNASLRDIIDTLVSGRQVLHALTIPEGLTSEQVVARVRESDVLVGDLTELPPEGSLLPETYKVVRGTPRADVIKKMQDDQKRAVDQIWLHRASGLPLRSPYELVTLASIVEKETGKADERPHVASVFLNRLKKGMRLQSDPTTLYGITGGKGPLGRGLTRAELDKPTPYNTYLTEGLPAGPIANPGRAALEAVANPSRTKDLYFVADGTGGHVFSETLDQHNRNVQHWRQIEKETNEKLDLPASDTVPANSTGAPQPTANPTPLTPPPGQNPTKPLEHKSDAAASIYGALPAALPPASAKGTLSAKQAAAAIAHAIRDTATKTDAAKPSGNVSAFAFGPGLDELGISVASGSRPSASATLDGPVNPDDAGEFPDSAAALPPRVEPAGLASVTSGAATPAVAPDESSSPQTNGEPTPRPKAFDASQGTPYDPLRNKTYDLNYAKTVPAMP